MSTEQLTAVEQTIALLGDVMNARATSNHGDMLGSAYENAADRAAELLRALEEVRRVGGKI